MNIKRFVASSMQEALKQIREELGADAVILSNEKSEHGVEIVAALDYDEMSASADLSASAQIRVDEPPSPTRIAQLHGERQLKLQDELSRAKQHISSVREARSERARAASAQVSNNANQRQQAQHQADSAITVADEGLSAARNAELLQVREEIAALKSLLSDGLAQPQQAGNAGAQMHGVQQALDNKLTELGISPSLKAQLVRAADGLEDFSQAWPVVQQALNNELKLEHGEIIDQGGVIALAGPTGSGKTTTIGKLAARYVMKFGADSIALVTTDRYRIAAHEQLKVFGRILSVPVHAVNEQNSLDSILDKLSDKKLVLVDTAGLMPNDPCWAQQLRELKMSAHRVQTYLVVSAVGQYQVMCANYQHYQMANLAGSIITKLDEAVSLGELISFLAESKLSVAYFTDGQRVPEDIHRLQNGLLLEKAQALLNSSERWVTIDSRAAFNEQVHPRGEARGQHSAASFNNSLSQHAYSA